MLVSQRYDMVSSLLYSRATYILFWVHSQLNEHLGCHHGNTFAQCEFDNIRGPAEQFQMVYINIQGVDYYCILRCCGTVNGTFIIIECVIYSAKSSTVQYTYRSFQNFPLRITLNISFPPTQQNKNFRSFSSNHLHFRFIPYRNQ